MPRLIQPDLPPEVEAAISMMGSRAQAEILRMLSINGPTSIGGLLRRVDVARPSLNRILVEMERSGVITGQPGPGARQGRTVDYQVNPRKVEELAEWYLRYTLNRRE